MQPTPNAETVCWQCGGVADERCAYIQRLGARKSLKADGMGYPVQRGWTGDGLRVPIPRCAACQKRNHQEGIAGALGALTGLAIALTIKASWLSAAIGLGLGGLLTSLAIMFYRKRSDLRSIADYPPIVQLRANGWHEPE